MIPTKRATFLMLLLVILLAGVTVPARADNILFNLTISWFDPATRIISNTTGSFVLDNTNHTLVGYSIDVPLPFGNVTQNNSTYMLIPQGPACGANNPCFELQITEYQSGSTNVMMLAFAGSLSDYKGGPILLHADGAISKAQCNDPCQFYVYGGGGSVPEPASMILLGSGVVVFLGLTGRKLRR
jgi:hypothetical protein